MTLEFQPKTEKEVSEAMLAPAGDYDFEVLKAEDATSKTGNPMITVTIGLYRDGSVKNRVTDYLLPAMEAKLRHFCDTTGLLARYEAGTLEAADCEGRAGQVRIVVDPAKDKYQAKNSVKDYICRPAKPMSAPGRKTGFNEGEDAPF